MWAWIRTDGDSLFNIVNDGQPTSLAGRRDYQPTITGRNRIYTPRQKFYAYTAADSSELAAFFFRDWLSPSHRVSQSLYLGREAWASCNGLLDMYVCIAHAITNVVRSHQAAKRLWSLTLRTDILPADFGGCYSSSSLYTLLSIAGHYSTVLHY